MTIRPGGLCGGDTSKSNFYANWVMLTSHNAAYYMQVGYIKYPTSSSAFTFVEVNSNTGFIQGPNVTNGDVHQYWLQYDPTAKHEKYNVDNDNLGVSHFDPETSWTQPEVPQWISETTYLQNSIPGTLTYPATYNSILTQRLDNDDFAPFNTASLMPTAVFKGDPWDRDVVNSSETETSTG